MLEHASSAVGRVRRAMGHDLAGSLAIDASAAGIVGRPSDSTPITAADVDGLPDVVQRYLRFMGVVGRPRIWSFRGSFTGRFRLRPNQRWMRCRAMQYNSATEVARLFRMRIDLAGFVPMVGLDRYDRGEGSMRGKLLGLFTVADGSGPEFDLGELTTYLNDAVLLAPSMLLGPTTTWTEVNAESFVVTLHDRGLTSTARVTLGRSGAPQWFRTNDRYAALRTGLVRAPWTTHSDHWTTVDGRALPTSSAATWDLPEGPFTYVDGAVVPSSIEWNVDPAHERSTSRFSLEERSKRDG
jgi:hypothetical protein